MMMEFYQYNKRFCAIIDNKFIDLINIGSIKGISVGYNPEFIKFVKTEFTKTSKESFLEALEDKKSGILEMISIVENS